MNPKKPDVWSGLITVAGTVTIVFMMGFATGWYVNDCSDHPH